MENLELQRRTLRLYGELLCGREGWGGKLVVAAFAGAAGSGLAAAGSLVGAASLTVDDDAAAMKAHFRDGAFDFVVNTLDEALRTLKNEIRQKRPIAIGLIAGPEAYAREADERGLAPDWILTAEAAADGPSQDLRGWLAKRDWVEAQLSAADVKAFVAADAVRARWISGLPVHQVSARRGTRWVWVDAPGA